MEPNFLKGEEARQLMLTSIYKQMFPSVATYISGRGGSLEEAKDVFHDALIYYYEKLTTNEILNHEAYVMGIVKHLWIKRDKEQGRFESFNDALVIESYSDPTPVREKMLAYVKQTGKKCVELLTAFYYDNLSMKELSGKFGFSGEHSATVQKFKCLEKIRNVIKEKSLIYEDFIE